MNEVMDFLKFPTLQGATVKMILGEEMLHSGTDLIIKGHQQLCVGGCLCSHKLPNTLPIMF